MYFMFISPPDYMLLQGTKEAPAPYTVPGTLSAQYSFVEWKTAFLTNTPGILSMIRFKNFTILVYTVKINLALFL